VTFGHVNFALDAVIGEGFNWALGWARRISRHTVAGSQAGGRFEKGFPHKKEKLSTAGELHVGG